MLSEFKNGNKETKTTSKSLNINNYIEISINIMFVQNNFGSKGTTESHTLQSEQPILSIGGLFSVGFLLKNSIGRVPLQMLYFDALDQ